MIYLKEKILGGIIMFNRIVFAIITLVFGIIALLFSLITFPLIMGWIAIICAIGAGLMILGGILGIVKELIPTGKFKNAANPAARALGWTGFTTFALTLLVIGCIALAGTFNQQLVNNQVPTNPSPTTAPTSVATTAPTAPAPTATIAVVDPALEHGTYPQTQIGHPNFYVETGTNAAYKWTFEVKDQEIGIVGGLVVDGKSGGVYRAYGPGKYTVTVQNGFVLTTQKEWAQNEFMFRVGQAVQYNWAHATVDYGPLTPPSK